MRVLGLDVPGTSIGGYAVYDTRLHRDLTYGQIALYDYESEKRQFENLNHLLAQLHRDYQFSIIAMEHPFLYLIAPWIGAIKMWVAIRHPDIRWYMVTASSARKTVFGNARRITRINRNGREVSAVKEFVLAEMTRRYKHQFTQHSADALLYALAASKALGRKGST